MALVAAIAAGLLVTLVGGLVLSVLGRAKQRTQGAGGGGLNYVVGPMGAGKSLFGVRQIVAAVCSGRYAVTNVRLLEGWETMVCRQEFPRDWRSKDRRAGRCRWLLGFYVYEPSLSEAMRYRPPLPAGVDAERRIVNGKPLLVDAAQLEGRAVFVWDESHNDLNNRDYQGHGSRRREEGESMSPAEKEKERRRLVLRFATQLRKLGYVGFLLSQHHENTDAQLRRVCNHVVKLQNQRQAGRFGKLLPRRWTLFLAYWFPAHLADNQRGGVAATTFERYLLPWHRWLYDSWELFHGLDADLPDEAQPIVLPAGGRTRNPAGAGPRESGEAPADAERSEDRPRDELASHKRSESPGRRTEGESPPPNRLRLARRNLGESLRQA